MRSALRWTFSFGGTDGLSPIARESERTRLAREQNDLLAQQNELLRPKRQADPRFTPDEHAAARERGREAMRRLNSKK
jgi:hypothetical protein